MTNSHRQSASAGISNDPHSSSSDEFVLINDEEGIPIRTINPQSEHALAIELHPVQQENALLVSLIPPREPEETIKHVSCDIVLVIDVSGSMASAAPLPDVQGQAKPEFSGLSILDLTKHAARTIVETLNEGDRLAIVTFSDDAEVIQPLTTMTEEAKSESNKRIESLRDQGITNLWSGIRTGLDLIEKTEFLGNVQGIYVLTDGMPNHMCPKQGYVAKLGPMLKEMASSRPSIPTIHTFGFGYSIVSSLLQSIAEVGNGNYCFIPESGMIGTVFVHAVANLYSTYATSANLTLTASKGTKLNSTSGMLTESTDSAEITLKLGNVQYGQSRDVIVFADKTRSNTNITATLTYKLPSGETKEIISAIPFSHKTSLPQSVKDYHLHRNNLCQYLSSLFPLAENGEHVSNAKLPATPSADISEIAKRIKSSSANVSDPDIKSLLADLQQSSETSQDGQISHALTETAERDYWRKWGRHYLPSLLHAHLRQQCNSFKDPGPLRYGLNSPLFIKCRDELDKAFDNLPAPKPSLTIDGRRRHAGSAASSIPARVHMSRYHSADNPCFLGSCLVRMANEACNAADRPEYDMKVEDLRQGMRILNPLTGEAKKIAAVIRTPARHTSNTKQQICRVGNGCWITPYHPIFHPQSQKWVFPTDLAEERRDLEAGEAVYSILLEPSINVSSHAIEIGGVSCVTLGHGLSNNSKMASDPKSCHSYFPTTDIQAEDARIHSFFGNHEAIVTSLSHLSQDEDGVYSCAGTMRSNSTGLVCGFIPDIHLDLVFRFQSSSARTGKTNGGQRHQMIESDDATTRPALQQVDSIFEHGRINTCLNKSNLPEIRV